MGHQAVAQQCAAIQGWAAAHGKEKRTDFEAPSRDLDSHLQVWFAVRLHKDQLDCWSRPVGVVPSAMAVVSV